MSHNQFSCRCNNHPGCLHFPAVHVWVGVLGGGGGGGKSLILYFLFLRPVAGYLGLALVFVWGGALRVLASVYQGFFASIGEGFDLAGGPAYWAIILWSLDTLLIS